MRLTLTMSMTLAAIFTGVCLAVANPVAVTCTRIEATPVIDGVFGAGEWAGTAMLPPLVLDRGGIPSLATEVRVGFDDRALYISARMQDPDPQNLRTESMVRDGAVQADDSLLVVLDRGNNRSRVVELAVNAAGTEYDAIDGSTIPTLAWNSATHMVEGAWQLEIAYEFGAEGAPRLGEVWGFNVRRNAPRFGEISSMTGSATLGTITFGWPEISVELQAPERPWYGQNTVEMRLVNHGRDAHTVKVNSRVTGPTRRAHSFEVRTLTIGGGQARNLQTTYLVPRGGRCALEVSVQVVRDERAITAFRTAPMEFELPALGAALDDAVSEIAAAYFSYMMIPAETRPFEAPPQLDMLLARWRYLDSQHQQRVALTPDTIMALMGRVRSLAEDAILMQQRFAALASEHQSE